MGASRPGADAEDEEEFKIPVKELSEGKKRDYGYGVPAWSPYYVHPKLVGFKGLKKSQSSKEYGSYVNHVKKGSSTDPVEQLRAAKKNIAEMKGRATTDHTWELLGHRHPHCIHDLKWTELSREGEERRKMIGGPSFAELLKLQMAPPKPPRNDFFE